ncbi:glycosyltransferase family 32 protein [Oceanirhabdus sp. W0125-5]|uniref:glycosyltransferase family 32 protein n=1 Tax=Oceanirhabdus sp. W0125-5 TaxID=2999116 RepID=UPI0022F3260F|nr:glycosyltransferase [Oceanirhabdus sp. W0125-5]WBW98951.1 capsular polysaccharide synthesis protein [Oceanirhabdus sp. W0125-5]
MERNIEKIPRIIHYCWFGQKEKPSLVKKCIASWKKNLKGYTFIEWNEDNFDINSVKYVKEAYEAKKYAFVSDYVRLYAIKKFGGIYLDTDVEVLKSFDQFLVHDSFWGFEDQKYIATSIIAAVKGHSLIKEFLDYYNDRTFIVSDGKSDMTTNVYVITNICKKHGLKLNGEMQTLRNGAVFYPRTYFSPYDYINGENFITNNSYAIHHFAQSWLPFHIRLRSKVKGVLAQLIGGKRIHKIRKCFNCFISIFKRSKKCNN